MHSTGLICWSEYWKALNSFARKVNYSSVETTDSQDTSIQLIMSSIATNWDENASKFLCYVYT